MWLDKPLFQTKPTFLVAEIGYKSKVSILENKFLTFLRGGKKYV
jgi:hypothetical protein